MALPLGFWEYDFTTGELEISRELANLYGVAPEDLTWDWFAGRVHPEDLVPELARPTASFPFGRVNSFFIRVLHADETWRFIASRSVTHGRDGMAERKLGVHIDMTDDELVRSNEEMAESVERLSRFAAVVGHDLRAPLRSALGALSLLLEDLRRLDEADRQLLEMVVDKVERADHLAADLLLWARGDADRSQPTPTHVAELLEEAVSPLDTRNCEVKVVCHVTGELPLLRTPIEICVRNLADNACKHHDRPDGLVTVQAHRANGGLVIDVTDDGPGVPEELRDRIFEPFVTSDTTRGSGFGLAAVADIARTHDADISLTVGTDRGSTFRLRWPLTS